MSRLCGSCGNPVSDDNEFCPICGEKMESKAPADGDKNPAAQQGQENSKKNKKKHNHNNSNNNNNKQEAPVAEVPPQEEDIMPKAAESEAKQEDSGAKQEDKAPEAKSADNQPMISINFDGIKENVKSAVGSAAEGAKIVADAAKTAVSEKKDNKKVIIIAAAASVLVILLIICGIATAKKPYQAPIDNLFLCVQNNDWKRLKKAFPEYMIEFFEDYSDYVDLEEMVENFHDELADDYGKNFKITYKITKAKKLDKDDLEDKKDSIKKTYKEKVKVTDGYRVKMKMTIKGRDDKETKKGEIEVYKIDGKWVIDDFIS